MLHNQLKNQCRGFSLLELVVAAAIVTSVTAWAIPSYLRTLHQGEVDRYNRAIEAGFFDLRDRLGTSRSSCQLNFSEANRWLEPKELLEFRQDDGQLRHTDRLRCCNSQINAALQASGNTNECEDGPKIGDLLNNPQSSLRFIRVENTNESKNVDVAVSRTNYELTPPGTSASTVPITFVVRSKQANRYPQLRQRCVQIDGTGHLLSGTWDGSLSTGKCNAEGDAALPTP